MTTEAPTSPTSIDLDKVRQIARDLQDLEGPLLPILQAVQETFGYIDEKAIPVIADVLNLSRAEVFGVVSFYHDFRRSPRALHTVRLCRAEACQSAGGEALATKAKSLTNRSHDIALENVYCLGLCAVAPAAVIDGRLVGRLDVERLESALADLAETT